MVLQNRMLYSWLQQFPCCIRLCCFISIETLIATRTRSFKGNPLVNTGGNNLLSMKLSLSFDSLIDFLTQRNYTSHPESLMMSISNVLRICKYAASSKTCPSTSRGDTFKSSLPFSGRGHPTEWRHFTNSPVPRAFRAAVPIRVMILMLATTYGESVSSIPILARGDPIGPMLKGMAYIVRPVEQRQEQECYVMKSKPGSFWDHLY